MTIYSLPTLPLSTAAGNGMRREMDRLMNEVFGAVRQATHGWTPATDAIEDATGYTLELDVPGLTPESIEVVAEDGVLAIRGRKEARRQVEGARAVLAERAQGEFERRFRLPKAADVAEIRASYQHGVLTVRIAKLAPAQPRRVQVTVDHGPVLAQAAQPGEQSGN
jgi:HSP20 family protein